MKTLLTILALTLSLNVTAFAEKEKITIRGIGLDQGKRDSSLLLQAEGRAFPAVIDDAEQLAKIFKDEDMQRAILKQADLKKETLLYFAWGGRTGDGLTPRIEETEEGTICSFVFVQGDRKDIHFFYHLYAVPKGAKWKVKDSYRNFGLPVKEQEVSIVELKLDGDKVGGGGGNVSKPVVINNADELAMVFKDEDVQRAILKQVDLKTRTLVYFAWSGSGRDSLTPRVEKAEGGPLCTFTYKRGLTKDLRSHHHLFAISKDAKWEVKHARGDVPE